jgi:hypothetical protein
MKGRNTLMALVGLGAMLVTGALAQAAVINQLNITGGSVNLNVGNGSITVNTNGTQGFAQTGTLLMGQYQASNGPTPIFSSAVGIGSYNFSMFTNPGPDSGAPLPTPSGSINGTQITVDLSSLFADISGPGIPSSVTLNLGNRLPDLATGTFDPNTGAFHIAWQRVYQLPQDFLGSGQFGLDGTTQSASPVPLPAAVYLFGTGLLALAGARRRRMSMPG